MQNVIFISLAYLKANTMLQQNVDSETVRPFIILAQEKYILPLVGTALYNKLCTDIQSNALSGNYLTLMETYLQNTLAWNTIRESISFINWQLTNKSVLTKNSENSQPASIEEIVYLEAKIADNSAYYAQRAINYLRANYTLFPELTNNNSDASTIFPERTQYFSGIQIPNLPLDERLMRRRNGGDDCDTNFYNYY